MDHNDIILIIATLAFAVLVYSFYRVNKARERAYNEFTERTRNNHNFPPGGEHSPLTKPESGETIIRKDGIIKNELWEIENAVKKGNANLLSKYNSQEKVDEHLKEFNAKLRKKFEDSGHLKKGKD